MKTGEEAELEIVQPLGSLLSFSAVTKTGTRYWHSDKNETLRAINTSIIRHANLNETYINLELLDFFMPGLLG